MDRARPLFGSQRYRIPCQTDVEDCSKDYMNRGSQSIVKNDGQIGYRRVWDVRPVNWLPRYDEPRSRAMIT